MILRKRYAVRESELNGEESSNPAILDCALQIQLLTSEHLGGRQWICFASQSLRSHLSFTLGFRDCIKTQESSTDNADYTDSFIEQLNPSPFSKKESV